MSAKVGKYTLIKTLGTGSYSKVKLGLDKETGRYYAKFKLNMHYKLTAHYPANVLAYATKVLGMKKLQKDAERWQKMNGKIDIIDGLLAYFIKTDFAF